MQHSLRFLGIFEVVNSQSLGRKNRRYEISLYFFLSFFLVSFCMFISQPIYLLFVRTSASDFISSSYHPHHHLLCTSLTHQPNTILTAFLSLFPKLIITIITWTNSQTRSSIHIGCYPINPYITVQQANMGSHHGPTTMLNLKQSLKLSWYT